MDGEELGFTKILNRRRIVRNTKSIILLASLCLLLSAPTLVHGSQAATESGALHFMPQEGCTSLQRGCDHIGQAGYTVGNLTYHGGAVMHAATNYLIFWLPTGFHFDTSTADPGYPNANDSNYESLVGRYFGDLSGTSYYTIAQQYTDHSGAPGLTTSLGGSWVDTSPYPSSKGSKTNPLQDSDIENEVAKALTTNGWTGNGNNAFFVFTGLNVFGCAGTQCSWKDYCAYHSAFQQSYGQVVVYSDIPDPGNANNGSCLATTSTGVAAPNGGAFADSAVNLVAHEGFEAVTDPVFDGWYYLDGDHEIGDECNWKFGSVAQDGSNIVLNGHKYLVQEMWSNKAGGCYIPQASTTIVVIPSYSVRGGGSPFSPPTFTYYSSGVLKNATLSTTTQSLNIDLGSVWNVTATLPGSTPNERWEVGRLAGGVISLGGTLTFSYYHQYLVGFGFGVLGGGSSYSPPSVAVTELGNQTSVTAGLSGATGAWVDAQSGYTYMTELSGSGPQERWVAHSPNGSVSMAGSVSLQYYHQYLVPLSYIGGEAAPTAPSLAYSSLGKPIDSPLAAQPQTLWLDAGSAYSVTNPLTGSNANERWFSTIGSGTVSSASPLQFAYHHQYRLSTQGGSIRSLTAPSIPSEADWYDSGTGVSITFDNVWNGTPSSRTNTVGVMVDGSQVQFERSGTGTFQESLVMDKPHTISVTSVVQYPLSTSGGSSLTIAPVSPTGDEFYDSGTSVSVSSAQTWSVASLTRESLVAFSIDGGTNQTAGPGSDVGVFTVPAILLDGPHKLAFFSVTQYLVGFQFTEAGGAGRFVPTSLEIQTSNPTAAIEVNGSQAWLDAGSSFVIEHLVWNNADVKPSQPAVRVDGPKNETFAARVYDATLKVSDYLQVPIAGATATIHLANGTTISRISGGDGSISLPAIPLGRYNATVSYLGASQAVSGNASSQAGALEVQLPASLPDFGAVAFGGVMVASVVAWARRRRQHRPKM